jgi:hypothetical protein
VPGFIGILHLEFVRISRRDAKRTAESAEKNNQILLLLFFALSAVLFASLRETACHFESILSQPLSLPGIPIKVMVTLHHPILLPPSVMLKPDLRTPIGPA